MSNRTVKVTLTLDNAQYQSAMRQAAAQTDNLARKGERADASLKGMLKTAATGAAVVGIAKLVKDSVDLEAAYSKTMRQVAVQTKAPKRELAELDDLAMKLGADTVFSAQDAGDAMLALAKGGLSSAQIQAGALQNSLTLAAAGNLELGAAADSVVNTMGAFKLRADQTGSAVAALAGAANASSADVSDITQALAQAGTEAYSAGLSVQETTGILAAFSNAGIKGSDAGTSLRTMLTRLVPQTKQQAAEMDRLGLSFTNANGEFVSGEEIAGRLQKAYKGMSAEERTASLNTVFGADARRAANVLIGEGTDGIRDYVKQTSDLQAAEKLAQAGMEGTSGAMEQLSGAVETAKIQLGRGLAPIVTDLGFGLADMIERADIEGWASSSGRELADFLDELRPLASSLLEMSGNALPAFGTAAKAAFGTIELAADVLKPFVDTFNALPESAQQALVLAAGAQALNSKFSITDRLAGSAAGNLLVFGGNAEKAGAQSRKGASGVAAMGASLKQTAAAATIIASVNYGTDQVDQGIRFFKDYADASTELAETLTLNGKATTSTVEAMSKSLSDGRLGKYADDLGIDIDKLAKSLGKGGEQGKYVKQVLDELDRNYSKRSAILGDIPFFNTDGEKIGQARDAIRDLIDEMDRARKKASQADLDARSWLIQASGVEKYRGELMKLPTDVVTRILTPGAIKSADDVESLIRKYALTPDLVRTLVKTSGVDLSKDQLSDLLGLADRISRKKTTAKVNAAVEAANRALRTVLANLRSLDGQTSTVTIRTIKETFDKPSKSDPAPSLRDLTQNGGKPTRATGGTVPPGYAMGGQYGGVVPGIPPANPRLDNVLAFGANNGQPLMVRSGEWIINQKQSDANDEWLAAINAGLNLNDILGPPLRRYAEGGRYDAGTALEITQMRVRVRDLRRSLRERETYKTKSGDKRSRPVLRGLDRVQARQELDEALDELRGTLRTTRAGRRKGMGPKRYNEYLERQDELRDEKKQQAAELKQTRADATSSFRKNATIGDFTTPAQVEQSLRNKLRDMATFTSLLIQLKKKGASPWLLAELQEAGPSRGAISLALRYTQDMQALASVNSLSGQLDAVSKTYGQVTTDKRWSVSKAWMPSLTSAQTKSLTINAKALDPSAVAMEMARVLSHQMQAQSMGAGLGG